MKEFILFVITSPSLIFAQSTGIIDSLEDKINSHRAQFEKLLEQSEKKQLFVATLDPKTVLTVDPIFLQSIILNSKPQYLHLLDKDPCSFYSLLENDLLRTIKGSIDNIVVSYSTAPKQDKKILIPKEELIRHVYKTSCFKNKDISILFNSKNRIKTISNLRLEIPTDVSHCKTIHEQWISNPYLPYICQIPELLSRAKKYNTLLNSDKIKNPLQRQHFRQTIFEANQMKQDYSFFTRTYLLNLCNNIDKSEDFCQLYTSNDAWRKITSGELPQYLLSFKCKYILNKSNVDIRDLEKCRSLMLENPALCHMKGSGKLPSILPRPNCDEISSCLNSSNLNTNYHDCPGNVDNEGIINIHRILMHLDPKPIKSDTTNCATAANFSFAKLNIDYENEAAWPMKVCYKDPASDHIKCKSYIPGDHPNHKLSETSVVASILQRLINAPSDMKCTFVDAGTFNPGLLKYRNKCFIVYDVNECSTFECNKKIFYKNKPVTGITYQGVPTFDYFPNSYKKEKFSFVEILKNTYKVQSKSIENLTEMAFHLQKKNRIVHGIGCAEDLLPRFFKKTSFNQCTPLPFIADGVFKKNNISYISTRTALDDLHSPRALPWSNIYSAVKTYQEQQPLKRWTLNGIY